MGRQVIKEMNRVGLVVDMSHSGDRSTIEATEISERPIAITHANPYDWFPALRNKKDNVIRAVTQNGGMIGFSLYPHHLKDKSNCTLEEFCGMIARTADRYGIGNIGIGSDLCQNQPDSVVEWMRVGRWTKRIDYGEGSASDAGFPPMPHWFKDNRDFGNLEKGLSDVGMNAEEIKAVMGGNWYRFFEKNFVPQGAQS
jgi:microsomal dipeptidase-like Zn-dependent dipeptidase